MTDGETLEPNTPDEHVTGSYGKEYDRTLSYTHYHGVRVEYPVGCVSVRAALDTQEIPETAQAVPYTVKGDQ